MHVMPYAVFSGLRVDQLAWKDLQSGLVREENTPVLSSRSTVCSGHSTQSNDLWSQVSIIHLSVYCLNQQGVFKTWLKQHWVSALHPKPWYRSFAAESDRSVPPAESELPLCCYYWWVFSRFGELLCHFCSNWNSNRNFLTLTETIVKSSWQWFIHRFMFQAFIVTGTLCNRHQHNAKKKGRLEEKILFLPMQMKGNDTMLPKRSHTINWFTVKSAKGMLRPSGLTSELQYCCSQRAVRAW